MEKKNLLLHSCCAPCSTAVIERLISDYNITIFYYNPNIYPKQEYEKRKSEQIKYIKILNDENKTRQINFLDCDYDSLSFYEAVKGFENEKEGGARCAICFKLRLSKTGEIAKNNSFDLFGTTLTVSPHKDAELINSIGKAIGQKLNIPFLEANFKKKDGYKRSIELSKQNNLYRQNYCGCEFALKLQQNQSDL